MEPVAQLNLGRPQMLLYLNLQLPHSTAMDPERELQVI